MGKKKKTKKEEKKEFEKFKKLFIILFFFTLLFSSDIVYAVGGTFLIFLIFSLLRDQEEIIRKFIEMKTALIVASAVLIILFLGWYSVLYTPSSTYQALWERVKTNHSKNIHLEKSLLAYQKENPNRQDVMDLLGVYYLKIGNRKKATIWLRKSGSSIAKKNMEFYNIK